LEQGLRNADQLFCPLMRHLVNEAGIIMLCFLCLTPVSSLSVKYVSVGTGFALSFLRILVFLPPECTVQLSMDHKLMNNFLHYLALILQLYFNSILTFLICPNRSAYPQPYVHPLWDLFQNGLDLLDLLFP
jgi:hypothetical protein